MGSSTTKFKGVATSVRQEGANIIGRYHHTDVCTYNQLTGSVKLSTNDYKTVTTKARMNAFSYQFCNDAFGVYQKKGVWYITRDNVAEDLVFYGDTIIFNI